MALFGHAAGPQMVPVHLPATAARLQPLGEMENSKTLKLAIGLPLRNQAALDGLLQQIYDPASPNYHHYLTTEQFTEEFGPTEHDYQTVVAFARANGLTVRAVYPNRLLVDVSGSVGDIERVLHVKMQEYQHPTENRTFYAPNVEPSIDLAVPILSIGGLNNYSLPRPRLQNIEPVSVNAVGPNAGSGPGGAYMGKDFRNAYVPDTALAGSGQVVGLLQFDGYTASDITYYENLAGLPNVTLTNVLIDGASGLPSGSGGEVEVSLDIEMVISMATNVSKVVVYEAPNPSPFEDILNRMVTDNLAKQLSCSWYIPNGPADPAAEQIWKEMAAQGQSFFNASGDYDAYTGLIDFPGDSTNITQVGGTTLTTTGPVGSYVSETVWNRGNGIGSGGGISTQYPIPFWQTNINMTTNQGSTTMRNTPDVALTAESVYVRANGFDYTVGGTSCAAPLWAGFTALVNQQAAATGQPTVGFINPAVDVIGSGPNYTACFHDITTGNNTSGSSPTRFYAVAGYDLCTGWGTPNGQKLINALANPEALQITPTTGFTALGGVGGPFTVTSQTFSLTNVGTNMLTWTLSNTSLWLNASASGGTLTPGGLATNVIVSLNSVASNLLVGTYSATLWFTNLNDQFGQGRQFTLAVLSPPAITRQPTNQAVLDGATANFTAGVTGGLPLYYQWQYNSNNLTDGGNISGSTTTNLTVNNVSAASVGAYRIIATNAAGTAVSSNALLTIVPSHPVITQQPSNAAVVLGATAQFTVIAVGTKPFAYQWGYNSTNISGATNASLILTNVQLSQTGTYAVLVTNIYGPTQSSNATLTVTPCDPLPAGIAAWWPGEGSAYDIINGNNGTPVGNLSYTNGEVGQAFVFDGSTSYIPLPATSSLNIGTGSGVTIECWIKPASASTQGPMTEWDSPSTDGLQFWVQPGLYLFANLKDTSGVNHIMTTTNGLLNTSSLQHVALTYDKSSGAAVIYLNGTAVLSTNFGNFTPQTTYPLNIGRRTGQPVGLGETYGGLIDELSLYNRGLSASEVAAIYQGGAAGKCFTPAPPVITSQPTNQTVAVGQTAILSVGATGTPPLSYQWTFNTANIAGATNGSLVLYNVQTNLAGTYAVRVSNVVTAVLSSNAVLTVNPAPTNCDPLPAGIAAWWPGEGNTFDKVNGNNGTPVGNLSYGIGEVGQAFAFDGSTSYIPVPASTSLNIGTGSGVTIECWIKPASANTQGPMTEWDSSSTDGSQFWVNPGLYLFANLKDTLGVNHIMATTNGLLNTNTLQHVALTYDKSSGAAVIYLNGTAVLSTNFGNFTPQTTYPLNIGRRTGQPVGLNQTYSGLIDELSLYNRALSASEVAAIYQAGGVGKCFTPAPPVITSPPTNQTVAVGQTAIFAVGATGTPPLSYQWTFNTTNISGATNVSLVLNNVQTNQAGTYAVRVSNVVTAVLSSNAVLTVNPAPTNCDPVPAGIAAWWPGEGNANDIVNGNNGTLVGGVTYTTGEAGQAFQLDGSSGYISVPASTSLNIGTGSGVTIEGWIKANNPTQKAMPLVEWDSGGSDGLQLWIASITAGDLYANVKDTTGNIHQIYSATGLITNGVFEHVALTYDKGSGATFLYINGAQVASANFGNVTPQTTYPCYLGLRTFTGEKYGGVLDEMSLYNRALSSNEIAAIYLAGSGGKCSTPTAPVITSQPANQTVVVGQTAVFSVGASGSAPLSYQWKFNTTNIAGATNASLVLNNVQLNQAGNYAVRVSNLVNSVISSNAILTVNPAPTNCDAAPSGIVSWWPGEGNAIDIVGTNNGVSVGGVSYTNGEAGQAFYLNGTDAYVDVPASASLNVGTGNGLTIEGWIKPSDISAQHPVVEYEFDGAQVGVNMWITTGGPGCLFANVVDSGNVAHYFNSASGVIQAGVFQHVALTYDRASGMATLYCNGLVVASSVVGSFTAKTSTDLLLGRRIDAGSGLYYQGILDEITLYNRALSSNEIVAIYLAGSGGKCVPGGQPVITMQPTNQTVAVGQTATFAVSATGAPPLNYKWFFGSNSIAGQTNSMLVLSNVQFSSAGNYFVVVTNVYGSAVSSNAILTIMAPTNCDPVPSGIVSWWPGEGNANDVAGTNNGIPVGGLTYTNGEAGRAFYLNGTDAYVDVPASGSLNVGTNNGLTIEGWINPSDVSAQHPVVEYEFDGYQSGVTMWITTGGPGSLWANIVDQSDVSHFFNSAPGVVQAGVFQHVALTYDKASGIATLYCNGSVVATSSVGSFSPKTSTDLLLGRRIDAGNGYYYWGILDEISLYNRALSSNEIAAIYLAGNGGKCPLPVAPVITSQPTNRTAIVGQTVAFSVGANGTAPLSYRWTFNTTNVVGGTNASLVLNNVQLTNAGNYAVVVSNLAGSVLSSNALLTVLTPVTIIAQPTNQVVYVGGSASFKVTASGTLPLSYQWNINQTNIANATNATLVLTNVQLNQAGNYAVLVTNPANSILSSNAVLTVNLPPELGVVPSGNYLYLFWPASTPGFVLEATPNLSPANWVTISNSPVLIGDEYLLLIQMTGSNQFYRLQLGH